MSGKIVTALAAAILVGSTVLASAQTRAFPQDRYWGGYGYYGNGTVYPPVTFGFGIVPGPAYYGYVPGYYDYAPGYYVTPGYDAYDAW